MAVALAGVLAVGCNDLDTEPLGGTVTSEQKIAVLEGDPSMIEASVMALPKATNTINYTGSIYGISLHNDYGYASMFLGMDSRGTDLIGPNDGYNWYSAHASLADWAGNYYANLIFWNTCYSAIKTSNTLLMSIDPQTENPELRYYRAQGLATRAYAYYLLVNMYQFSYCVNPDAPCVPIITDQNLDDAAVNGSPQATVQQVWDQVEADVKDALGYLADAKQAGITRPDRRFVDEAVLHGMLARTYLFTQQWNKAAEEAQAAISLTDAVPYSIAEASVPGFYNLSNPNYMWGIQNLASMSFTQGVVNFASMMGSWMPNGYCSAGCVRRISKKLYAEIPTTDARKNWWLDGNANIPATLPSAYVSYINSQQGKGGEFKAYFQVKFAAAENTPGTASGATDVPMMRVEEMYLILAEAQGMVNPAQGAATLQKFVSTYRDPEYQCDATTKEEIQYDVWMQRRIELWGEGFAFFDLMRLNKGINRLGCGFPTAWVFVVAPDDNVLHYQITSPELSANPALDKNMYDTGWVTPQPVPDEE